MSLTKSALAAQFTIDNIETITTAADLAIRMDDGLRDLFAEAFGAPVMLHAKTRDGSLREVASDQNPPTQTPSSARPAISTAKDGASATTTSEISISAVSTTSTVLRLIRPAMVVIARLVATAKSPLIEIACPVCPVVAPSPSAIGVNRLTGMNSDAISIATQSDMDQTAAQAPWVVSSGCSRGMSVKVCSVCLPSASSIRSERARLCGIPACSHARNGSKPHLQRAH